MPGWDVPQWRTAVCWSVCAVDLYKEWAGSCPVWARRPPGSANVETFQSLCREKERIFIRGAPVRIWGRSQKAVCRSDTDLFKTFLSCRIIYNDDPIKICRYLLNSGISFLKMNSPLRWLLWEDFSFEGWRPGQFFFFFTLFKNIHFSHLNVWSCTAFLFWHFSKIYIYFFTFFKNIHFSHLNVWSCTAFLFWQPFNCCTIAYTQHKPDFMSSMWDGPEMVHTYSVFSAYAVHERYTQTVQKHWLHCEKFF